MNFTSQDVLIQAIDALNNRIGQDIELLLEEIPNSCSVQHSVENERKMLSDFEKKLEILSGDKGFSIRIENLSSVGDLNVLLDSAVNQNKMCTLNHRQYKNYVLTRTQGNSIYPLSYFFTLETYRKNIDSGVGIGFSFPSFSWDIIPLKECMKILNMISVIFSYDFTEYDAEMKKLLENYLPKIKMEAIIFTAIDAFFMSICKEIDAVVLTKQHDGEYENVLLEFSNGFKQQLYIKIETFIECKEELKSLILNLNKSSSYFMKQSELEEKLDNC